MRRTKKQIERDGQTYSNLGYAIRKHGIGAVRKAVFGVDINNEQVAMCQWINTRMFRGEIQDRIEELSN
jgi:hypothetical protein